MIKLVTSTAALAMLAGSALADTGAIQLYDAQGHLVGQLGAGSFYVYTSINNNLYELEVQRTPGTRYLFTAPTAAFWYPNTTCAGQRYLLDYGETIPQVYYDGQKLWSYGNSVSVINGQSYWDSSTGKCVQDSWPNLNAAPAVNLGPMPFYPPYYPSRNGSHSGDD
jgi:hypothetical protein